MPPKEYPYLHIKEGRKSTDCLEENGHIYPGTNVVIWNQTRSCFIKYANINEVFEYNQGDYLLHEVISGWMEQRPKFDIDGGTIELFNEFMAYLKEIFVDEYGIRPDFAICDSSGKDSDGKFKFSRHVIIINCKFKNSLEAQHFTEILRASIESTSESDLVNVVDFNINKSSQNFRIIGSKKADGRVKKLITNHTKANTFITLCKHCIALPERVDTSKLKHSECAFLPVNGVKSEVIREVIERTVSPGVFVHNMERSSGNMLIFDRIKPSNCEMCGRIHTNIYTYLCIFENCIRQFCGRSHGKKKASILVRELISDDKTNIEIKGSRSDIRDVKSRIVFFDCFKLMDKLHEDEQVIKRFVLASVAYVLDNDGFFIFKEFNRNGEFEYRIGKSAIFNRIEYKIRAPESNEIRKVKLTDIIDSMITKIGYSSLVCRPYLETDNNANPNEFNLFIGFMHNYNPDFIVDTSKIDKILYHIRHIIARDDDKVYKFMISWLADIIQNPDTKSGVCVILYSSEQGTGKSSLCDFLCRNVIGTKYTLLINNISKLTSKFNKILANVLLTIGDELSNKGNAHKFSDRLKAIITQTQITIQPKGLDEYVIDDNNSYLLTTNHKHPVIIERTDRRYFALELDNKFANNKEYFSGLRAQFNGDSGEHFFNYLCQWDLSEFNSCAIPATRFHSKMKLNGVSSAMRFVIDIVMGLYCKTIFDNGGMKITPIDLYELYSAYNAKFKGSSQISKSDFIDEMDDIIAFEETPDEYGIFTKIYIASNRGELNKNILRYLNIDRL